jgi:hypothetical protein
MLMRTVPEIGPPAIARLGRTGWIDAHEVNCIAVRRCMSALRRSLPNAILVLDRVA